MNNNYENINAAAENAENAMNEFKVVERENTPTAKENPVKLNAKANAAVYNHKFRKPFEFEGKRYDVLNFNFERLTGRDMIAIENEMQANNEYALDPLLSRNFQSKMAARAGGIGSDVLESMPLQEFNRIVTAARNFLIDSGY